MSTIPFENQLLPSNPIEQLEHKLAHGMAVSGHELRHAIERSIGRPLDDRLRKIISQFSVAVVKRRGRPSTNKGREDFALQKVDDLYPALLRKYEEKARKQRFSATEEGAVLARAEQTPSELAYSEILDLKRMKAVFPNIGWQALRNLHSKWNSGHFHSQDHHVDSDDYDAEIVRLFPAPSKS
jgi:hypothetical protein